MRKYKTSFFTIDFILIICALALFGIGVLSIFSTGIDTSGEQSNLNYIKQMLFGSVGIICMVMISLSDYTFWKSWSFFIYISAMFLLFLLLFVGREINSARSWLGVAGLGIQPAELSKLTLILMLSSYFSKHREELFKIKHFIISSLIVFFPFTLILAQPDLGTSVIHLGIYFIMALIAGINPRYLFFCFFIGFFGIFFSLFPLWNQFVSPENIDFFSKIFLDQSYFFIHFFILLSVFLVALYGLIITKQKFYFYLVYFLAIFLISSLFSLFVISVLKPYQVQRLLVFLDPEIDPQGSGWNIRQSILAIGSGGIFGQGFLKGFHAHNNYVPAQSTDFIFSLIGEEWGFLGTIYVFSFFILLIFRIYTTVKKSETYFGSILCIGILALLLVHFWINIGMAIGLFPIMGIPLPFISYGGSSLLVMFMSLGIVLSVYRY